MLVKFALWRSIASSQMIFGYCITATFEARNKWRNILLNLKVNIATIESIGSKFRDNPDECYREGLVEWLKGEERSWEDVVEALSSPIVGHSDIATTIERNHILPPHGLAPSALLIPSPICWHGAYIYRTIICVTLQRDCEY